MAFDVLILLLKRDSTDRVWDAFRRQDWLILVHAIIVLGFALWAIQGASWGRWGHDTTLGACGASLHRVLSLSCRSLFFRHRDWLCCRLLLLLHQLVAHLRFVEAHGGSWLLHRLACTVRDLWLLGWQWVEKRCWVRWTILFRKRLLLIQGRCWRWCIIGSSSNDILIDHFHLVGFRGLEQGAAACLRSYLMVLLRTLHANGHVSRLGFRLVLQRLRLRLLWLRVVFRGSLLLIVMIIMGSSRGCCCILMLLLRWRLFLQELLSLTSCLGSVLSENISSATTIIIVLFRCSCSCCWCWSIKLLSFFLRSMLRVDRPIMTVTVIVIVVLRLVRRGSYHRGECPLSVTRVGCISFLEQCTCTGT